MNHHLYLQQILDYDTLHKSYLYNLERQSQYMNHHHLLLLNHTLNTLNPYSLGFLIHHIHHRHLNHLYNHLNNHSILLDKYKNHLQMQLSNHNYNQYYPYNHNKKNTHMKNRPLLQMNHNYMQLVTYNPISLAHHKFHRHLYH